MEPKEQHMDTSESRPMSVDEVMRDEQEHTGTVAEYVTALAICFEADDNYRANLLQLKRISAFLTEPYPGASNPNWKNCFYWGSILGMAAGDRVFNADWSDMLYENVSDQFLKEREAAAYERIQPQLQLDEHPMASKRFHQSINASNIMLGILEQSIDTMPSVYRQLIVEWANKLSADETEHYFVTAGFSYVLDIAMTEIKFQEENAEISDLEASVGPIISLPFSGRPDQDEIQ